MEKQPKNVQIDFKLFLDLVSYHLLESEDPELAQRCYDGLNKKLDSIVTRDMYSRYKTAPTEEEREKARQEYLDKRGVHRDFRW